MTNFKAEIPQTFSIPKSETPGPTRSTLDGQETDETSRLLSENIRLQNDLLHLRDYAIGTAAELGVMRSRYAKAQYEVESLIEQLELLHSSRTWRIGRIAMIPLRALRWIVGKLIG